MNDLERVVVGKFYSDEKLKEFRPGVLPGEYDVDFEVRFRGQVKVGEDYDRASTTKVCWVPAIALVREAFEVTVDELIRKVKSGEGVGLRDLEKIKECGPVSSDFIVDCVRRSIISEGESAPEVTGSVELDSAIKTINAEIIDRLPRQFVPGRVNLRGVTMEEVVEEVPVQTSSKAAAEVFEPGKPVIVKEAM